MEGVQFPKQSQLSSTPALPADCNPGAPSRGVGRQSPSQQLVAPGGGAHLVNPIGTP